MIERSKNRTHNTTHIVDRTSAITVDQIQFLMPDINFLDEKETGRQLNEMKKLAPGCFTQCSNTRDATAQFLGCLEAKLAQIKDREDNQHTKYFTKNKDLSLQMHKEIEVKNFQDKMENFNCRLDLLTLGYGELYLKLNSHNREYAHHLKVLYKHLVSLVHKSENEVNFKNQSNLSQLKMRVKHQFHELKRRKEDKTKEINSLEDDMNKLINQNYELQEEIDRRLRKTEGMENQIKKYRFTTKFYKKKYDMMKEHYKKVVEARLTEKIKIESIQERER